MQTPPPIVLANTMQPSNVQAHIACLEEFLSGVEHAETTHYDKGRIAQQLDSDPNGRTINLRSHHGATAAILRRGAKQELNIIDVSAPWAALRPTPEDVPVILQRWHHLMSHSFFGDPAKEITDRSLWSAIVAQFQALDAANKLIARFAKGCASMLEPPAPLNLFSHAPTDLTPYSLRTSWTEDDHGYSFLGGFEHQHKDAEAALAKHFPYSWTVMSRGKRHQIRIAPMVLDQDPAQPVPMLDAMNIMREEAFADLDFQPYAGLRMR